MLPTTPATLVPRAPAVLLIALALAGCGQKGPLYLPEDAPTPADETQAGDDDATDRATQE